MSAGKDAAYPSVLAAGAGLSDAAGVALAGIATTGQVPSPLVWLGIAVVLAGLAVGLRTGRSSAEILEPATGRVPRMPDHASDHP